MHAALRTSVPAPGTLVNGRYRVGGPIGEGGMGVVLAAHDEKEDRDVAIKLLQVTGEQNMERFLREARLSMKIDSPHVVRVLDVGALGHCPYFVMERLEGEDFGAKVREQALTLTEVADCVVQTCEALAHAHGTGIVHRDIKASNLFEHIQADGGRIVKVLDFGISKMFASSSPHEVERTLTRTRDGGFLGSPPYMSPEHVKDPRNVDGRADLWSLGVVAYRLLSTQFPFPGESTGEVLAAILEGKPRRLRQLLVDVPELVDSIIVDRCLARDRDDRYPDAGEVALAFAPYASPQWRELALRIPSIVGRGVIPSPIERSSKRRMIEPSTETTPPPAVDDDPATLTIKPFVRPTEAVSTKLGVLGVLVPSPLEVLSSGPLPITRPLDEKPKSSFALIIALSIALVLAIGGIVFILTRRPPPALAEPAVPVPTPSAISAPPRSVVTADPTATPATSMPTTMEIPSTTASATTKPPTKRNARPVTSPRSLPIPVLAPAPKKPELEQNPYTK